MEDKVSIINKTKGKLPGLPFVLIKEDILGKEFSLSIAFISKNKSKELNNKYRGKNKSTNILSFPYSKNEGEILICPDIVKTETRKFGRTFRELLGFLVIHGMLHLKGMEHSSTMEKAEKKYDQKYFSRN
ncbi:MAG: rRNA maturation RNase YbeY [bacterium]